VRRLLTGICLSALLGLAPIVAGAANASSGIPPTLNLVGHGWGHGRGMGQYGALGYASAPYDWNYGQIVGHYYGGTKLATVANQNVNVNLTELAGAQSIVVAAPSGTLMIAGGNAEPQPFKSPWTVSRGAVNIRIGTNNGSDVVVESGAFPSGQRSFQGSILLPASPAQVWNVVPLEAYVDGVVPRESPASWPAAALEAQAVAARSYALADLAGSGLPYICDTTACQVYGGDPAQYGPESASFYQQSDAAVAATAYQVLECNADAACGSPTQIALTEFSSSTGGYTAGGAFPAVPDLGDATPSNPNHTWTASVATAQIQAAFPAVGALESVSITGRNGLGDLGGRVTQMVLAGTAGQVTITGSQFAGALGLKSNWFAFTASISGMTMTPDGGGYYGVATNGGVYSFGDAKFYGSARSYSPPAPIVGMATDPATGGYWEVSANGGVYSFHAPFYGSARGHTSTPIAGIVSYLKGGGYLLVASGGVIYPYGDAPSYGEPLNTYD
jgi:SpoIID/LytB domain protein